jgi:hypothetical protein
MQNSNKRLKVGDELVVTLSSAIAISLEQEPGARVSPGRLLRRNVITQFYR